MKRPRKKYYPKVKLITACGCERILDGEIFSDAEEITAPIVSGYTIFGEGKREPKFRIFRFDGKEPGRWGKIVYREKVDA